MSPLSAETSAGRIFMLTPTKSDVLISSSPIGVASTGVSSTGDERRWWGGKGRPSVTRRYRDTEDMTWRGWCMTGYVGMAHLRTGHFLMLLLPLQMIGIIGAIVPVTGLVSRSSTGSGTMLTWRCSQRTALPMSTPSLSSAARLRAWKVGRREARIREAIWVYRELARRRMTMMFRRR
jgi:hypothetical protein